ncbi:MAG: hypothetical protein ACRYGK_18725 [Janthinobacterium lividum]
MISTFLKRSAGIFLACCMSLSIASVAHAGLIGRDLSVIYAFPDPATEYQNSNSFPPEFTVNDEIETVLGIEETTTFFINFTDMGLTIWFNTIADSPTFNIEVFNGLIFTKLSADPWGLDVASISSTLIGNPLVSFVGDQLRVNFSGLSYMDGAEVDVQFKDAPAVAVSEPPLWSLLLLALLLSLAAKRLARARVARMPVAFPAAAR